jgi:SAM-dependent methyltransferase
MDLIEKVKKFWDTRPCNVRHSPKEVGTKDYFLDVSKRKYTVEPHIKSFANFSEWKGKKVLEIGCGIGTDAQSFAEAGAIYTGVDLSEKSLEIAKKRFDTFGLKGNFYKADDEYISKILPIDSYDLIYSFGVIHHTPFPEILISEITKYMSEETTLRIMLYAKNSWKNFMIDAELDQPEAQYGCPIANTYSKEEVESLLTGLDIVNMYQTHIFPYKIDKYKTYEYEKQDYFKAMPEELFSVLEKNLGWHLLIEAKLDR